MTILPQSPYISPLTRTDKLLLVVGTLFFLGLSIFLLFPTETVPVPPWFVELQSQVQELTLIMTPYLVVGALGAIVAIAELSSTFQTYPREALNTRWARILILVNVVSAILALVLVRLTMPQTDVVVQVLTVGVGFQGIIRTRFVLAKPMGKGHDNGEISLNLGWLYDQFQNLCRTQIDLELMNNRRTAVTRLITYYPSSKQLYDIAWYTIIARATLSDEEEAERLAELERLIDPKAPESLARTSIALVILENGGQAYVNLLLDQAMSEKATRPVANEIDETELVRQVMNQIELEQMPTFCASMTDDEAIHDWVEKAAAAQSDGHESSQKAGIALFLVQQVGADRVERALTSWASQNND